MGGRGGGWKNSKNLINGGGRGWKMIQDVIIGGLGV